MSGENREYYDRRITDQESLLLHAGGFFFKKLMGEFPEQARFMHYFAYGSNCNPEVLRRKNVRFRTRRGATLSGFRLAFNKKSLKPAVPAGVGFANISTDSTGVVEGILYELVAEDLPLLDRSERFPEHYIRIPVAVETAGGRVECVAYQARDDKIATGLKPSQDYLNHLLAAREFLSAAYYETLARTEIFLAD